MLRFRQRGPSVKAYGDDDKDDSMSVSLRASFQEHIQAPHTASLQNNFKPLPKPGYVSRARCEPVYPPSVKDPPRRKEPLENRHYCQHVEDSRCAKPSQPSQSPSCLPYDRAQYQSQERCLARKNQELQKLQESFAPLLSPSFQVVAQGGHIKTEKRSPSPTNTHHQRREPCSNSDENRCHVLPLLATKHGRTPLADISLGSGEVLRELSSRSHKILDDHHNVRQGLSSSKKSEILKSQKMRMSETERNQDSLPDYGRRHCSHLVKSLPLAHGEQGSVLVESVGPHPIKMDRQVFVAVTPPRMSLAKRDAFRARQAVFGVGAEKGIEKSTASEAVIPFHFIAVNDDMGSPTSTLSYSLAKCERKTTGTIVEPMSIKPMLKRVEPPTVPGQAVVESPSRRHAVPYTVIAKGLHEPVNIVALDSPSTISSMNSSFRSEPRDNQIILPSCFLPSQDTLPGHTPGQRCFHQRQSVRSCAPTEESNDISRSCITMNWLPRFGSSPRNEVNTTSTCYISLMESPSSPLKEKVYAHHTAAPSSRNNSRLASSGFKNHLELGPLALRLEPVSKKRTRKIKHSICPPDPWTKDPTMKGEC
jgi:hypothetical protein